MSILRKIIGFPFALLWDIGTRIRNACYDLGLFQGQSFDLPIIGVGNLAMGGTGKTPHVEYLIQVLQNHHPAVLSRGYKRKTSGYIYASTQSTVKQIGDEPLLYKLKHPNLSVAVSENRVLGIPQLLMDDKQITCILLDDIFQHRAVSPGLMILLSDYNQLYTKDMIFPAGDLRESKQGAKRADIIIVTKCPNDITKQEAERITKKIKPLAHQAVYFSSLTYGIPYPFIKQQESWSQPEEIVIATGIAKPTYLQQYLDTKANTYLLDYPDHHTFTERDIYDIAKLYQRIDSSHKAIYITEKDAVKLTSFSKIMEDQHLRVYVQPIQVNILFDKGTQLNQQVITFVENFYHDSTT